MCIIYPSETLYPILDFSYSKDKTKVFSDSSPTASVPFSTRQVKCWLEIRKFCQAPGPNLDKPGH